MAFLDTIRTAGLQCSSIMREDSRPLRQKKIVADLRCMSNLDAKKS